MEGSWYLRNAMNTLRRSVFVSLALSLGLVSCQRSDSNTSPLSPGSATQRQPAMSSASSQSPGNKGAKVATVQWLKRARWVLSWSAYREVVPASGSTPAVREPAPGAHAVVVDLDAPETPAGSVPATLGQPKPNLLEQEGTLQMKTGEVTELSIKGDVATAIGVLGDAAAGYWTTSAKIMSFVKGRMTATPFASLYIQAKKPGRSEVTVRRQDGGEQRFSVVVSQ